MKTFEEWIEENHPESVQEGWMKNVALGGALLGAGMGIGGMGIGGMGSGKSSPDNAVVSKTSKPKNAWQLKRDEIRKQKEELTRKTQGLKSGESRTFIHGKAQSPKNYKSIDDKVVTSDDADEFLN
jgi:hypothetical protein